MFDDLSAAQFTSCPMKLLNSIALVASLLFSLSASADEATIKRRLEERLKTPVESVTKTPYFGLYEVFASGQLLYTDEQVSAIISGSILDIASMKNITAERMKILSAVKFSDLPLELAVKSVRGNGARVVATFEDPNCGYCKRIQKDLSKLDNVTIYTFLYPILSPDSVEKAKRVWCSTDRAKAWSDMMTTGAVPAAKTNCDAPVQQVLALGRKYSVTGTPTLIFADGEKVPGAINQAEIEVRLAKASPSAH